MAGEVTGEAVHGFPQKLMGGSRWINVGATAEGAVYRPLGGPVTVIGGKNNYEGYVVVRDGSWVGFWLPYERAFSPLSQPVPVKLNKEVVQ